MREGLEKDKGFLFRFITFYEVKESLREVFGAASDTILYLAALKAGRRSCRRRLETAKSREEALKLLVEVKANQNWGDIAFEDLDSEKCSGKILIKNSFETRAASSKEPVCYFFKGYLVGFFSELLQREVALSEDKCAAKGDSHCQFAFQASKER